MELSKKVLCGIVTYNCAPETIKRTIDAIKQQVSEVILVDNGSSNFNAIHSVIEELDSGISVISNGENKGIATALNQICKYANDNGYEWVLTLDQDSECPVGLIEELLKHITEDTGVIAPNIIYRNNERYADKGEGVVSVKWVITSASLTNVSVWREIDGFDERLFIDGVDRDFCYRVGYSGKRIYKDYNISLLHELGKLNCKRILGKTIYVTHHSAFRLYYLIRNSIYLDKKHSTKLSSPRVIKTLIKVVFFEEDKKEKMRSIFMGIKDGMKMTVDE